MRVWTVSEVVVQSIISATLRLSEENSKPDVDESGQSILAALCLEQLADKLQSAWTESETIFKSSRNSHNPQSKVSKKASSTC